ncbi:type 1 glutamine amidotransferase [Melioribacteraceae bacterium 4301-Me]|uniref:type 1 glutamine amidotransferase n=1 Tax=Pyranulibacter aquaticus TaxID=3163344 RepID=UPI003596A336
MEKEILIIKNESREGPGLIKEVLEEHQAPYKIIDLQLGETLPPCEDFGAVVVLGGSDSANDESVKIKSEINYIQKILQAQIPYLGICLGLQLLVKSSGGKVVKCPFKEIGFIDPKGQNFSVQLTEEGRKDQLFNNLEYSFNVFHLHGETVELTKGMILLATGSLCRNQIVKIGSNAYGIQCHFELTNEMFERWIKEDPDLIQLDRNQLRESFSNIYDEYVRVGRQLFANFLKIADNKQ